jgi:DNA-binding response OmpR family regulator
MKKILIVEDDKVVANIYRNKLSHEGFKVEVALDGMVGLDLVSSFCPDAVILDLMLPSLTGVEFVKRVRANSATHELPVIVFSNTYLTNMVQEAWKAGATKCLSKANCTPKQVIEVLRNALGTNGSPAEAEAAHPGAGVGTEDDENRVVFLQNVSVALAALRFHLQGAIKAESEAARLQQLKELYSLVHTLTGNAAIVGLTLIAHVSDALEALLKELLEKPRNINSSALRTVASAIDCLAILFDQGTAADKQQIPQADILVVDDEAISRRALVNALERAKLKCLTVENPKAALELLSQNKYDLVFLDVDMPGMNGFELCTKLRTLPAHEKTPVVFVTALNNFESRANSTMSGGNDFIAKPFLFIELAVKALLYILRSRFEVLAK